jgi:hypothetical protein
MQGGPGNPGVDIRGQRALEIDRFGQEAADAFTRHNADPIELAYEKRSCPFICWRKEVM